MSKKKSTRKRKKLWWWWYGCHHHHSNDIEQYSYEMNQEFYFQIQKFEFFIHFNHRIFFLFLQPLQLGNKPTHWKRINGWVLNVMGIQIECRSHVYTKWIMTSTNVCTLNSTNLNFCFFIYVKKMYIEQTKLIRKHTLLLL